jgi:hypothetical protein
MPEHYRYGGGTDQSLLHPLVALLLAASLIGILLLPRRHASLPLLSMVLLAPLTQQIYVAGIHLFVLRLVVLAGMIRAMFASNPDGKIAASARRIDRAFLYFTLAGTIAPILLFQETQAVIYQIGYLWDWLGGYILCRWLIQDEQDIFRFLKFLAILLFPVAAGMLWEQAHLFNVFSLLGGLSSVPLVRDGKIRSQGVFSHSLMAGCFAAVLIPLFFLLWKEGRAKVLGSIGLLCSGIMVITSNSSTTLLACVGGVGSIFLWPMRRKMRPLRILLLVTLIGLHLVMKAPVWFLIARIDLTGGSSSYHRAVLVDQFIRNFSQWWLIGTDQNGTWGLDTFDVQNQYVNTGIAGGLVGLFFLFVTLSRSFSAIGKARLRAEGDRHGEWVAWLLGCSMFATVLAFFGVNYFDQGRVVYFALLAMIAAYATVTVRAQDQANTLLRSGNFDVSVKRMALVSPKAADFVGYEDH